MNLAEMPFDEDASRQFIDACAIFEERERVASRSRAFLGGMLWKTVKGRQYLVRTSAKGRRTGLCSRDATAEAVYGEFVRSKTEIATRLRSLDEAEARSRRVNKALRVGRVPNDLVAMLQALRTLSAGEPLLTGVASLHAVEWVSGQRLPDWMLGLDSIGCKLPTFNVELVLRHAIAPSKALAALRKGGVWLRAPGKANFRNERGDGVSFLDMLRTVNLSPAHWRGQLRDETWLARSPRWSEIVVAKNGQMTRMTTPHPRAVMLHAAWKASHLGDRSADRLAAALKTLLGEHLDHLDQVLAARTTS